MSDLNALHWHSYGPGSSFLLSALAVPFDRWDEHGRLHRVARAPAPPPRGPGGRPTVMEPNVPLLLSRIRGLATRGQLKVLDLRKPFVARDPAATGRVSARDFAACVRALGATKELRLRRADLEALAGHFDPLRSGEVRYSKFLWAVSNKNRLARKWAAVGIAHAERAAGGGAGGGAAPRRSQRALQKLFWRFDATRKGVLSREEFERAALLLGLRGVRQWELECVMDRFSEGDGSGVSYAKFCDFLHALDRVDRLRGTGDDGEAEIEADADDVAEEEWRRRQL